MRGALAVPIRGTATPALVVQNGTTTALEFIDPIDPHVQPGAARYSQGRLQLGALDTERRALALEQTQGPDQPLGTPALPSQRGGVLRVAKQVALRVGHRGGPRPIGGRVALRLAGGLFDAAVYCRLESGV